MDVKQGIRSRAADEHFPLAHTAKCRVSSIERDCDVYRLTEHDRLGRLDKGTPDMLVALSDCRLLL